MIKNLSNYEESEISMENILLKIRSMYDTFGRGERKIADWLLEHPNELIGLSISGLSNLCGCGDATVVRFCKRLGLSGFQALKVSIAQEHGANHLGTDSIQSDDSCLDIYSKHIADIFLTLEKTKSTLDEKTLDSCTDSLLHARSIAIFGLGSSAAVAQDAAHKLLRAGFPAHAYSDNHMQMIAASHLQKGDVALAISHSGSSVDVVKALQCAHEKGAATIAITHYGRSPILKHSDYVLYTNADETKYSILAMTSRLAQLAIIDTLYLRLLIKGGKDITQAIKDTESALETHKY